MATKFIETFAFIQLSYNFDKITVPFSEIGNFIKKKKVKIDGKNVNVEAWKKDVKSVELYYKVYDELLKGYYYIPIGSKRNLNWTFGWKGSDNISFPKDVEDFYKNHKDNKRVTKKSKRT